MAKRLDKFSKPFRDSHIPFLLAEIITDGEGEMVDVVCRFINGPAAALLEEFGLCAANIAQVAQAFAKG